MDACPEHLRLCPHFGWALILQPLFPRRVVRWFGPQAIPTMFICLHPWAVHPSASAGGGDHLDTTPFGRACQHVHFTPTL
eukprot:NODE_2000_length_789_cov_145.777027_g1591_i0.p4 GENE.NODE_2000_length_789_cov_145.777027_g1591_i0~~NODE_2000_length_789_cov_145.777027_g1591_i0.p4  ORF type:complete len:80 (+),score=10.44 NODE_2000_length_789_cov_145.777027_g1591_i0:283-522(+)